METQQWLVFFSTFIFFIGFMGNVQSANADSMFVFGDSYADAGNQNKSMPSWLPPYGIAFPGKPWGHYSNGRVLTDFVASYVEINSPVPYELRNDFDQDVTAHGISFAYGGTGVFNTSNGLPNITAQIKLLEKLVEEGVYSVQDLKSSVVLVSVAGNDYLQFDGNIEGVIPFVVLLIKQLSVDLESLYNMGIRNIAVTSLAPLGCLPVRTIEYYYKSCNETENMVALFHKVLLEETVDSLNKSLPGVNIVVLDLYTSFMSILSQPEQLQPFVVCNNLEKPLCLGKLVCAGNFNEPLLKSCCIGNTPDDKCGSLDDEGNALYTICTNPSSSFFWDMVHPTQEAWQALMTSFASSLSSLMPDVPVRSFI